MWSEQRLTLSELPWINYGLKKKKTSPILTNHQSFRRKFFIKVWRCKFADSSASTQQVYTLVPTACGSVRTLTHGPEISSPALNSTNTVLIRCRSPPPLFNTHLLSDDHQRVSVLRQEVEDAPDLEGVIVGDEQLALIQVFPGAQRPAHFVEVLTVKIIRHLCQEQ